MGKLKKPKKVFIPLYILHFGISFSDSLQALITTALYPKAYFYRGYGYFSDTDDASCPSAHPQGYYGRSSWIPLR